MSRPVLATKVQAKTRAGSMAEAMARKIADASGDGIELVEFAFRVFRDQTMPFEDRKWAFEWIADRGAGKAMAKLEVSGHITAGPSRMSLEDYTLEELDEIEAIQRRAQERKRLEQTKVIDVPSPTTP